MRPDEPHDDEGRNGPSDALPDLPIYEPDEDEDDFDDELDEDEDDEDLEDGPRTVLITGACGNIGRKLRAAW